LSRQIGFLARAHRAYGLAVIAVSPTGAAQWDATLAGAPAGRMRGLRRPDGRLFLYHRDTSPESLAALLDAAIATTADDLYLEVAEAAPPAVLTNRGFTVHRREQHYRVPTDVSRAPLGRHQAPPGYHILSAAEADLDRLRLLDDALRQDVPGTSGWRNDPATFAADLHADPAYDPETYLIAADSTGAYAALVRVWIRPAEPRLGLIATLPEHRRQGLAAALITQAFGVVHGRGHPTLTCAVDATNTASTALMQALAAAPTTTTLELLRPRTAAPTRPDADTSRR
jgi:GNAT superfamily N-acetyltransferase